MPTEKDWLKDPDAVEIGETRNERYVVYAISKRPGKCMLKLWNQKQGCFCWVPKGTQGTFLRQIPETRNEMKFIKFGSHRARDYALREIERKPKSFYSCERETGVGGVYQVTEREIDRMKKGSRKARFTILRGPYDDLRECWKLGETRNELIGVPVP